MKLKKGNLCIDPSGGMSGDMFSAALIDAGADFAEVSFAMRAAAGELGSVEIKKETTGDGSSRLQLEFTSRHSHLTGGRAVEILEHTFSRLAIQQVYRFFGLNILSILLKAERAAHREHKFLIDHIHSHHNGTDDHHNGETLLHEAQDIVLDICGAVTAMQALNLRTDAFILAPVSVGGGTITFSHGTLPVPAPATEKILQSQRLPWQRGPVERELCTPTGAAILAALSPKLIEKRDLDGIQLQADGQARGSRTLPIPPLRVYIVPAHFSDIIGQKA